MGEEEIEGGREGGREKNERGVRREGEGGWEEESIGGREGTIHMPLM